MASKKNAAPAPSPSPSAAEPAPDRDALIAAARRQFARDEWSLADAKALAAKLDELGDSHRASYREAHGKNPSNNGWPIVGGGPGALPFSLENFRPATPDGGR